MFDHDAVSHVLTEAVRLCEFTKAPQSEGVVDCKANHGGDQPRQGALPPT